MIFIDTNYFVRFLLRDIPAQHEIAKKLIGDGSKGNLKLFTSIIVIFELYWLFTSFYEKTKAEVCEILANILSLKFIIVDQRDILERALNLYQNSSLDLEDCYNIIFSKSQKMTQFATFDKNLLKALK